MRSAIAPEKSSDNRRGKTRFLQEAKNLVKFRSEPGIVEVTGFIEENNTAYIITEYLAGVDLRTYLHRYGTMKPDKAFSILLPVMETLDKISKKGYDAFGNPKK